MTLTHLATALLLCGSTIATAQAPGTARWADSLRTLVDRGVATGQPATLDAAIALADRVLSVAPKDGAVLHYKGFALYRKAVLLINSAGKPDDAKPVLEEADDALEQSFAVLKWGETPALRSSVMGQQIALGGMMAGMRLGGQSNDLMDEAVRLAPTNPRVLMLRGIGAIYKPTMFGGGTDKAEADLKRAVALYPNDKPAAPAPAWGHAEAWAWLGQVYVIEKKYDDAKAAYDKALSLQPDFGWVTYQLLPALEKARR